MKHLKNFKEAHEELKKIEDIQWRLKLNYYPEKYYFSRHVDDNSTGKFKDYKDRFGFSLYLQPETLYLGIFNRLQKSGDYTSYNFTTVLDSTISKTYDSFLDEFEKIDDIGIQISRNYDFHYVKMIEKPKHNLETIYELIQLIFSDNYLETNKIDLDWIKNKIEVGKIKSKENPTKATPLKNIRLEEIKNDLRILFMINPLTAEIKLCYSQWKIEFYGGFRIGLASPIQKFFYYFFFDDGFRNRFFSRNDVSLNEKFEYEASDLNIQSFLIYFHTYGIRMNSPYGIAISSGKAQMKFMDEFLTSLILNFGEDDFLYSTIHNEKEICSINVEDIDKKKKKLIYYEGHRIYSTPQFDIIIQFRPVELNGNMYFKCGIMFYPYHNEQKSIDIRNKGWGDHRLYEFWEIK
jgi:hypothetical protein